MTLVGVKGIRKDTRATGSADYIHRLHTDEQNWLE